MAITRSQIPNQIDVFDEGGDVTFTDENAKELSRLIKMSNGGDGKMEQLRQQAIKELGGDFETNFPKYNQRLKSMFAPPSRDMNIYDLATQLGAGLLTTPNRGGRSLAQGLGVGFQNIQKVTREEEERDRQLRQQIGMKAFELAQQDERTANEFLNQVNLAAAKKEPSYATKDYEVVSNIPITIGGVSYEQGEIVALSDQEHYVLRDKVRTRPDSSGGIKVPAKGQVATYMSDEDARQQITSLGMSKDSPYFEQAVSVITAGSEAQIGTPVIMSGQYMELVPLHKDGEGVINILTSPISGGSPPPYITYRNDRLKALAKTADANADKHFNVLPSVERAMDQLMGGVETGKVSDVFLPFKQLAVQIFGIDDPQLAQLEDINAISNYLAPKMRPVGSGSTSDMEFRAYQNALLSLEKTPAANYIALYAYKKMVENGLKNNEYETELLTDQKVTDAKVLNERMRARDTGIFVKLPENIKALRNEDGRKDEYLKLTLDFWASLPPGAVFDNSEGIFSGVDTGTGPFLIKDWKQNMWENP